MDMNFAITLYECFVIKRSNSYLFLTSLFPMINKTNLFLMYEFLLKIPPVNPHSYHSVSLIYILGLLLCL